MRFFKKGLLTSFIALSLSVSNLNAEDGTYEYVKLSNGNSSVGSYFSSKGAPYIYQSSKCSGKGKSRVCWPVIVNQSGKVLASYGSKDSVGSIASGRYSNIAYLMYSHYYKRGKKTYVDYYLMDNGGKKYKVPKSAGGSLDKLITLDANLMEVGQFGIYLNGSKVLSAPTNLTHGNLANNLTGNISVVAVSDENKVLVSNTKEFITTDMQLSRKGDRKGILSSYPNSLDEVVFAVYKYVNSYNKGLMLGKADFTTSSSFHGWLYNSEIQNVGFDPDVYIDDENNILIGATNSSSRVQMRTSLKNDSSLMDITKGKPKHIEGFEDEEYISLLAGTALSKLSWNATNDVEDENENSYGTVEYDIADSLYTSVYLQGKVGDVQIAVNHLQNKAEEKDGATQKASKFTSAMVDIDGFFSPQSSLRIVAEKAEIGGTATFSNLSGLLNSNDFTSDTVSVKTEFTKLSAFVMKERGMYHGLDYSEYTMPSLVGYGKDGSVKFTIFDPASEIKKITYNWGYDELSYARRYENNFSRFYLQGLIGVGIANVALSGDLENLAEQKAKADGYEGTGMPMTFAADYVLDLGYIVQGKAKILRGLGMSAQLGYKVRGTYYTAGTSSDSESDSNELSLEYERNDIWHGPYVSLNIVF